MEGRVSTADARLLVSKERGLIFHTTGKVSASGGIGFYEWMEMG